MINSAELPAEAKTHNVWNCAFVFLAGYI
jgi:hypothetical protein